MKAPCCPFVGGTLLLLSFIVPFSFSAEIRVVGADGSTVTIPENHLGDSLVDDLLADCVRDEDLCRREVAVDVARVIAFLVRSSEDESHPSSSGSNLFPCDIFQSEFDEEEEADIKMSLDAAWKDIFKVAKVIEDLLKVPSIGELEARSIHTRYKGMQTLQVARTELTMRSAFTESLFEQVVELTSLHLNWHDPAAVVDRDLLEELEDHDPHQIRMAYSKEVLKGITTLAITLGYASYDKQCPDVSRCPGKLVLGHSPRNMPDVSDIDQEIIEAVMKLATSSLEEELRKVAAGSNDGPTMTPRDALDLTALINTVSMFYPNMLPSKRTHHSSPEVATEQLLKGLELWRKVDKTVEAMVTKDISEVELYLKAAVNQKNVLRSVGKLAVFGGFVIHK